MNDSLITEATEHAKLDNASNEAASEQQRAEHLAQVKQALKSKEDSPLRHLGMPDLGAITDITLTEFDELRRRVVGCQDLYAIPKSPKFATLAETICRACHLLFALVESGGLCVSHPERAIERIRIDVSGALGGYLRWSEREPHRKAEVEKQQSSGNDSGDNTDAESNLSTSGFAGPRQHLYTLGHAHLMTFVYYRVKKDAACDGDLLLPPLPASLGELKRDAAGQLTWLKNFKGKVEWRRIFRFWLNTQLSEIRGRVEPLPAPVSWTSIVHLALWRILPRERRALLLAARQNSVATSPLPDSKVNDLLAYRKIRYRKIVKKERDLTNGITANPTSQSSQAEYAHLGLEQTEIVLLDAVEGAKENAIESKRDVDRQRVSEFLATLKNDDTKKVEAIKAAKTLADSAEVICGVNDDLRYLLRWVGTLLRKRKELSTAHTYASRVIRAMHAFDDKPLSLCTTEDIAAYLENYESPNSVRNVRGTLEDFDNYLIESKGAPGGRINWQDKSLLAYEQYRERDCVTEDEYRRVRESIINNFDEPLCLRKLSLLTLLRRCGLRADEAAWLVPSNFLGWTQPRLLVMRSKTRAGRKRMLPLYLLLDKQEQDELRHYVNLCKSENPKRFLFADGKGERVTAHTLGRETEALLRAGGIQGETAHGLRHAFATGLFAAWWLQLTRNGNDDAAPQNASWARRALEMYARPGIESRAVSHAYHIQLLLGHADLRVTFDRYIHVVDLACADAVLMAENRQEYNHTMRLTHAARFIGMDDKELRSAIHESQRQNAELDLSAIRPLLRGRVANLDAGQAAHIG